jgi:hypothetical protein
VRVTYSNATRSQPLVGLQCTVSYSHSTHKYTRSAYLRPHLLVERTHVAHVRVWVRERVQRLSVLKRHHTRLAQVWEVNPHCRVEQQRRECTSRRHLVVLWCRRACVASHTSHAIHMRIRSHIHTRTTCQSTTGGGTPSSVSTRTNGCLPAHDRTHDRRHHGANIAHLRRQPPRYPTTAWRYRR